MRFMLLVKASDESETGVLPDEQSLSEMREYNDQLIKAGALLEGEGLQASSRGSRVRIAGNASMVVDGPFSEAKELVAGYWLIQVGSKQEALDWATRAPFQDGELELRQVYEPADLGIDAANAARPEMTAQPQRTAPPRKPGTTRFMTLLKADRNTEAGARPSPKLLTEMLALMAQTVKTGTLLAGDGLQPSAKGARIRFSGGKPTVIDGPFSESKELIAGFSIIQTRTKQEAIDWARRCLEIHVAGTGIDHGEIEVRQVFELADFPVDTSEQLDGFRQQEQTFRERSGQA